MKQILKSIFLSSLALALILSVTPVFAAGIQKIAVPNNKSATSVVVSIPEHAVEVSPDIFYLGTSVDSDGALLEGYAVIDRRRSSAKPTNPGGGKGNGGGESCYAYLANGAKWKSVESYRIDPSNAVGLLATTVESIVASSLEKWDVAAESNIFGNQESGTVDKSSIGQSTNNKNEVAFGTIDSPGAIAVTYVWGIFSGSPNGRYLAEWDMIYDQDDFSWSTSGDPGDMDFENIATHEIGHAAGMGHPSDTCAEETMYRFAGTGETKKRDLNGGDIAGIKALYQ